MWREIGMIGRDRVLQEIGARAARKRPPFLLTGPRGSGKTALLEWAFERAPEPKAFISASDSPRDSLVRIARSWGLQHAEDRDGGQVAISRARIKDLERAVLRQPDGLLFIDDINMATPTFINKFKVWRERFATFAAGVPPFAKEDLKRNLWGLKTIEVPPLAKQHRLLLAQRLCEHLTEPPHSLPDVLVGVVLPGDEQVRHLHEDVAGGELLDRPCGTVGLFEGPDLPELSVAGRHGDAHQEDDDGEHGDVADDLTLSPSSRCPTGTVLGPLTTWAGLIPHPEPPPASRRSGRTSQ